MERCARILRVAATVLFVAAVPVFLVASNVRWVVSGPWLYSYGLDKYDIPTRVGIERAELLLAARQIRDYFNNDNEFLTVSVVREGIRVQNLYNRREVLHMKDVKGLVQGVYRIQEALGMYLTAFMVVGLATVGRGFLAQVMRCAVLGGAVTLGLIVLVGLALLVGFDRLFLAFHLVSFSNDLWQLDPSTDYLIAMFPQGFFFDATLWITGLTILEALLLIGISLAYLWLHPTKLLDAN